MSYRAINFDTDIKVDLGTFFALEPGDGTRYQFTIRQVPNGVMGWSREEPLWEFNLYDAGGCNGSSILFADHGGTIRDIDLRFPDTHVWEPALTRRAALASINHVLYYPNPYAGAFTEDPEVDGYTIPSLPSPHMPRNTITLHPEITVVEFYRVFRPALVEMLVKGKLGLYVGDLFHGTFISVFSRLTDSLQSAHFIHAEGGESILDPVELDRYIMGVLLTSNQSLTFRSL